MTSERAQLIAYIESLAPPKQCINVIHGITTYDDVDDYFEGRDLREKAEKLTKGIIAASAFYHETVEIHASPPIISLMILSGAAKIVLPHDQKDLPANCSAYISWGGDIKIFLIGDPDAVSIKFYK